MVVRLKRVYEPPAEEDGFRVLVERLWPRGISKEHARLDLWMKEAGASTGLRKWFGHDPAKWEEFRRRYYAEIAQRPEVLQVLREVLLTHDVVTFLFAAHDKDHNNAVALKEFFDKNGAPGEY
jgi:uncharacterized protein YeaO (DUF488 family)